MPLVTSTPVGTGRFRSIDESQPLSLNVSNIVDITSPQCVLTCCHDFGFRCTESSSEISVPSFKFFSQFFLSTNCVCDSIKDPFLMTPVSSIAYVPKLYCWSKGTSFLTPCMKSGGKSSGSGAAVKGTFPVTIKS